MNRNNSSNGKVVCLGWEVQPPERPSSAPESRSSPSKHAAHNLCFFIINVKLLLTHKHLSFNGDK